MLIPLLLFCALPGILPAAGPPLPPTLPETLLAAPVNLTWAANHAGLFRSRGIHGFVAHGLAGEIPADPAVAPLRLMDAALRREVRAAVARLKEAGIPHHFLRIALHPEEAWFSDPEAASAALRYFQAAGAFCRETGLAGLALDTQSQSPIHHPRWDGYPLEERGAARVRAGARRFGSQSLRAFIREYPEADILIIADDLEAAGPLWFEYFAGLVEAPGAAETVRLHVVPRASARRSAPEDLRRTRGEFQTWLDDRLPPEVARHWRATGGLAHAVAPLGYAGETPVAYLPPAAAHTQFAAALLLSDRFVWVDAPEGGWWPVPEEDAVRYAHLLQDGPAAVGAVRPLHPLWARYTFESPLRELTRVGAWPDAPGGIDVLSGARGAAALFWEGLTAPLRVPNRFATVLVTDLAEGTREELFPREGGITVPAGRGPLLIDGLPHGDWTVPAGLWIAAESMPDTGQRGMRLRYGWRNATGQPMAGALGLEVPPRYGAGAALEAFELAPGGAVSQPGQVLGRLLLDEPLALRVTLTLPGDRVLGREMAFPVGPAARWSAALDGSAALGPPTVYTNAAGRTRVLAGSAGGDVRVLEADGTPVWTWRGRSPLAAAPTPMLLTTGRPGVLAVDQRGRARLHEEETGALVWERSLPGAPEPGGMLADDIFLANFDGALIAPAGGALHCLLPSGAVFWTREIPGRLRLARFTPARAGGAVPDYAGKTGVGQRIFIAQADGDAGALIRMDPMGHLQWRRAVPTAPSTAPLVAPLDEEEDFSVAVGLADGSVRRWHANHGMPMGDWTPPTPAPVAALAAVAWPAVSGLALLVAGPAGVWILDGDLETVGHLPVPGALDVSPWRLDGEDLLVVTDTTGRAHAYAMDGGFRWRAELGAATPLVALGLDEAGRSGAVFGTLTGVLRAVDLGSARRSAPPAAAASVAVE